LRGITGLFFKRNLCRRLEGVLVSNTVGIATMQYNLQEDTSQIQKLRISWGQSNDDTPQAIFRTQDRVATNFIAASRSANTKIASKPRSNIVLKQPPVFWPLYGVAVVSVKYHRGSTATSSTQTSALSSLFSLGSSDTSSGRTTNSQHDISVKVIILGDVINVISVADSSVLAAADASLAFQVISSAIFVVTNPHESPSEWEYSERIIFPVPSSGHYLWFV
jgi:hypothetical protein